MILLRQQITHLLRRQSPSRRLPTLLIQGETGTGKGLLARAVHNASARSSEPFVDADCVAIPETLLEAELFGFERGAFTDAKQAKLGLFQSASGGTIFLDEVGLLPRTFQAKLLKVVEEKGVRRLGSTQVDVVDLWVIAATNVDLAHGHTRGRLSRGPLPPAGGHDALHATAERAGRAISCCWQSTTSRERAPNTICPRRC